MPYPDLPPQPPSIVRTLPSESVPTASPQGEESLSFSMSSDQRVAPPQASPQLEFASKTRDPLQRRDMPRPNRPEVAPSPLPTALKEDSVPIPSTDLPTPELPDVLARDPLTGNAIDTANPVPLSDIGTQSELERSPDRPNEVGTEPELESVVRVPSDRAETETVQPAAATVLPEPQPSPNVASDRAETEIAQLPGLPDLELPPHLPSDRAEDTWNVEPPTVSPPEPSTDPSLPIVETDDTPPRLGRRPQSDPFELPPPPTAPPGDTTGIAFEPADVIEISAREQQFDEQQQIFTAEGDVLMRFRGAVLDADWLQVNLLTRMALAEGNVALTRGEQVLRGQRFRYNFVQETGTVYNARGEAYFPTSGTDFATTLPTDVTAGVRRDRPLSDRIIANQPPQQVTSTGGITLGGGAGRGFGGVGESGTLNRIRYEAEQMQFYPGGWEGENVRLTNDPFSPPELEVRADRATFTRLSELRDEILTEDPRLVFDGGFSLPILKRRTIIDRRERDPSIVQFGFDQEERGGFFLERTFEVVNTPTVRFQVTPQYFAQQAFDFNDFFSPQQFGAKANLDVTFSPRTTLEASGTLTNLNIDNLDLDDELRASVRLRQLVGDHTLTSEFSYRDRLFNGSLGFQTVRSSIGLVLTSPVRQLGNTGINYSYQVGYNHVRADTDRQELLEPFFQRDDNLATLDRYQASMALNRGFTLWRGNALPATPEEGLRYTPRPVVPYVNLSLGLRGVASFYSNGEEQNYLTPSIGVSGQFGHFSRKWLDYTAFNLRYAETIGSGESPFFFDREVDRQRLSFGLTQQVYGPFRVGFESSVNLDSGESISTDYIIEYSRRSYNITLRFNPQQEIGSILLRVNGFNWSGGTRPFDTDVRSVEGGVVRDE